MNPFSAAAGKDDVLLLEVYKTELKLSFPTDPDRASRVFVDKICASYNRRLRALEADLQNIRLRKEQALKNDLLQMEQAKEIDILQRELALKKMTLELARTGQEQAPELAFELAREAEEARRQVEEDLRVAKKELNRLKITSDSNVETMPKAEFYDDAHSQPDTKRDVAIKEVPANPTSKVARFAYRSFTQTREVFAQIEKLLAAEFPDFHVSDTHGKIYPDPRPPSITISRAGVIGVHPIFVHTVIELKRPRANIDSSMLGQGLDQLHRLTRHQPWRERFTMLVTNLKKNYFLQIRRTNGGAMQLIEFVPVGFETAIDFIGRVLEDPCEEPALPGFSVELGAMKRVLGLTKNAVMGIFELSEIPHTPTMDMPPEGSIAVAVKWRRNAGCSSTIPEEIQLLCQLNAAGGHKNVAKIVYYHPQKQEFGMLPAGEPATPISLNTNPAVARMVLQEILSAIIWLHKKDIVHRNIRWGNIVLHRGSAVLIDFGAAINVSERPSDMMPYSGGNICCPPRLLFDLDAPAPYTPEKNDDYYAYLLLANSVLFPKSMVGFREDLIGIPTSDEAKRLQAFWTGLKESLFWQTYVQAAAESNTAVLGRLTEVIVTL